MDTDMTHYKYSRMFKPWENMVQHDMDMTMNSFQVYNDMCCKPYELLRGLATEHDK